jgi:hypothetical protein
VYEEEVAFTPVTTPVSKSIPVERAVALVYLAVKPFTPPDTPELEIPRVEVATQRVDVPVV